MRNKLLFLTLVLLIPLLFLSDLFIGSVNIPFHDIIKIIFGEDPLKESWTAIILKFRLPKAITAMLVGAGLSICGLLMQTLFRNPLAGPFVLGVNSGASLGVAMMVLASGLMGGTMMYSAGIMGNLGMVGGAIIGAIFVLGLIIAVMRKIRDSVTILIIGLMFSYLTGAIVSILMFFSTAQEIEMFVIWGFGSFGGVTWNQLVILIPIAIIGVTISFTMAKPLNALLLGENYAISMGLNVNRTKYIVIICTGLLAGSITAYCGPIAFIGIAVAHLARISFNTSDHRVLLPATCLIGINMALLCDLIAQMPGSSNTLPVNAG